MTPLSAEALDELERLHLPRNESADAPHHVAVRTLLATVREQARRIAELEELEGIREAFLSLIADATEFSEDQDADCDEGVWVDHTTYRLVLRRGVLEEFAWALGLRWHGHDDSAYAALVSAANEPVAINQEAGSAPVGG